MAQIIKKFIGDNQVADEKIRLDNDQYLRGRNAANSGDINLLKVDSSNKATIGTTLEPAANSLNLGDSTPWQSVGAQYLYLKSPGNSTRFGIDANNINSTPSGQDANIALFGSGLGGPNAIALYSPNQSSISGTMPIYVESGNSTGSALDANSGELYFKTGDVTDVSNNGDTGKIFLVTGDAAAAGDSGNIELIIGASVSGTRGSIVLNGPKTIAHGNVEPNTTNNHDLGTGSANWNTVHSQEFESAAAMLFTANSGDVDWYVQSEIFNLKSYNGSVAPQVRYYNAAETFYVGFKAANALAASATYTWPSADGTSGQVLSTNGSGTMSWITPAGGATWEKETFTLAAGDITNQYVDLANVADTDSIDFVTSSLVMREGSDYTVNYTGGAGGNTRITFAGDLATSGASELVAGDVLVIKYTY